MDPKYYANYYLVFMCLLKGHELPSEWKTVKITNLHKKGDRKNCGITEDGA